MCRHAVSPERLWELVPGALDGFLVRQLFSHSDWFFLMMLTNHVFSGALKWCSLKNVLLFSFLFLAFELVFDLKVHMHLS